jgi:hypothetical protein
MKLGTRRSSGGNERRAALSSGSSDSKIKVRTQQPRMPVGRVEALVPEDEPVPVPLDAVLPGAGAHAAR